jgi:hypothetical protein
VNAVTIDPIIEALADYEWRAVDARDFERFLTRHGAHGRSVSATVMWFDKVGAPVAWVVNRPEGRTYYLRTHYMPPVSE